MSKPSRLIEIYKKTYEIFPNDKNNPKLQYVNREWIFPNHIDLVIENGLNFVNKYYPDANKEIVFLGALLHDTGLVYKRTKDDPKGHEERSIEFAQNLLKEYNYTEKFIKDVIRCIKATKYDNKPQLLEAKIVRTADGYSHLTSIHFLAKSNFTDSWDRYFNWFSNKINQTYNKLTISEVKQEIKPIYEHYRKSISIYNREKEMPDKIKELFNDSRNT
jgi:hypothetical protein